MHVKAPAIRHPHPKIILSVRRLPHGKNIPLPAAKTEGASGMDICAAVKKSIDLSPMERLLIPSGLCVDLPKNHELQVRPRSGLAWEYGITVLNAPGTIDADYHDEIKVILINLGKDVFTITYGMRIAQLVLVEHRPIREDIQWKAGECLTPAHTSTNTRTGGFGSTGEQPSKKIIPLEKEPEYLRIARKICANHDELFQHDKKEMMKTTKKKEVEFFEKIVLQEDADAQNNLGWMYYYGQGVTQSYKKAAYWYQKSALQGHADSQFCLGVMYEAGQGVAQIYKRAVFWYEKAATQGDVDAQFNLGEMYEAGQGVPKNITKAKALWEKAAAQGHADAQKILKTLKRT